MKKPKELGVGALIFGLIIILCGIVATVVTDGKFLFHASAGHERLPTGGIFFIAIGVAFVISAFSVKNNSSRKKP